jgi:hypothetical protein
MLTYLQLAVGLLKLVNYFLVKVREDELRASGYDQAIADMTQSILSKTAAGKAIMEKVNAMSEVEVDAGLRGLEPK